MITSRQHKSEYPFKEFEPIRWKPPGIVLPGRDEYIYSVKRDHGVNAAYQLHNPNDEINEGRNYLDKVIIEYKIGRTSYDLFTVGDFFWADYMFSKKGEGNIVGDLAERISRRITKYFLHHHSKSGRTGGIFDGRFNPKRSDDFVVAHSSRYILKIQNYPNLVILKRSGSGKYGYENIKELDGLFDYRYKRKRHILVLESKCEKVNVNVDYLINHLFVPLRELFPDTEFSYVLFTDRGSIYRKKDIHKLRKLKQHPLRIYQKLKRYNIGTLYFAFNESRDDFERMKNHLITQYRSLVKMDVQLHGKMILSPKKIVLFDGGETPRIKLIKDKESGMWREVKLYHKKK